jgi:hypothetical protein
VTFEQANALGDWIVIGALLVCVFVLTAHVNRLRDWKRKIEGITDLGDWIVVSRKEWDYLLDHFFKFEFDIKDRLTRLERGIVRPRVTFPNKWKPWAR